MSLKEVVGMGSGGVAGRRGDFALEWVANWCWIRTETRRLAGAGGGDSGARRGGCIDSGLVEPCGFYPCDFTLLEVGWRMELRFKGLEAIDIMIHCPDD